LGDIVAAVDKILREALEVSAECCENLLLGDLQPRCSNQKFTWPLVDINQVEVYVMPDQVELVLVIVGGFRVADHALVLVVGFTALPVSLLPLVSRSQMPPQKPGALKVFGTEPTPRNAGQSLALCHHDLLCLTGSLDELLQVGILPSF
jgi:hypothetical protein